MSEFYWEDFIKEINASIKPGAVVLDAGAGDGLWQSKLPAYINYISMDLGVGDGNVDYSHLNIQGDLKKIPLEDASVDVVICIQVLEHVPEPWQVLDETYRILKPGGILFLTCPQSVPLHQEPYDFYRYTKYGLHFLIERSGYIIEFIKPQKGSVHKLANDLKILSNEMEAQGNRTLSFFLKFVNAQFRFLFKKRDHAFLSNTTGYFTKSIKPC